MFKPLLALAVLTLLTGCDPIARDITVLKCATYLDQDFRCPQILKKGSELTLKANTSTQKVQLDVTESNEQFSSGKSCSTTAPSLMPRTGNA